MTRVNADPDLFNHMAPLGHIELKIQQVLVLFIVRNQNWTWSTLYLQIS